METGLPPLAAFISPGLLTAAMGAAAAPILIHLLARRRFKRIRWAAIDFLLSAQRRNRRRINMEDWVLAALRCLAVVFLGLIVARPFILAAGMGAVGGGSKHTERIFVIDDSFSMGYKSGGSTSFDRAKVAVRRLIESIRSESPDDTVTLLRATAVDEPLESGTYLDDTQTEELLARLEALSPSQRSMDPPTVVNGLADLLESAGGIVNAAVYVISDFQREDWAGGRGPEREDEGGSGLLDPLAAWAGEDRGLRVVLVNVGDHQAANTAITNLDVLGGQLVAGTPATIRATLANHAPRAAEGLQIRTTIGGAGQTVKTVRELGARQEASVELRVEFVRAGFEPLRVELAPDALPVDNERFGAPEINDAVRILIVSGEPSADESLDEVLFLTTALRPEGEVFSGNELEVIDETELEEHDLAGFHLVILANVYRVSEPAVDALERFVREGGGLIIALGDQVDADLYNAALYRDGKGLAPARLTEVKRVADPVGLVIKDRLHPAVRGLSREGDPLGISQIAYFQFFECEPVRDVDGEINQSLSPRSPRTARVVASYNDAEEHAAFVEHSYGRGRVLLLTSAIDKEWNDWPDHPTYLPVLMEMVHHIARQSGGGMDGRVGEAIEFTIDPATFEPDLVVRTPAYPAEQEVGVTATLSGNGPGLRVTWEQTDISGIYQFLLARRDGGETVRMVPVNVDPRESDLLMAQEDELRRAMGQVPVEYVEGTDQLAQTGDERRTELWRFFLFMTAAILLGEQGLAWRWGRRR